MFWKVAWEHVHPLDRNITHRMFSDLKMNGKYTSEGLCALCCSQEAPQTLLGLHQPKEGSATLFGLHESLDAHGYQRVLESGDLASMESFLQRLLQSHKHDLLEIVPCLAQMCFEEKKDFDEVLSIMGQEKLPGSACSLGFSLLTKDSQTHGCSTMSLGMEPQPPAEEEESSTMPLHTCLPFQPLSGSASGGFQMTWLAEPVPLGLWLGGRPCAPLRGSCFVAPCGDNGIVDVVAIFQEHEARFLGAFSYWDPGVLLSITPSHGTEGTEVQVITSELGAEICQVNLGGQRCELLGRPCGTGARFLVPANLDGLVEVQLLATNGNELKREEAFTVMERLLFGAIGCSLSASNGSATVRRTTGVSNGVCITARPLRQRNMQCTFRLRIDEMSNKGGIRALAVGFAVLNSLDVMPSGHTRPKEATDLSRAWLVGYDKGGALFCSPNSVQKLPSGAWRPATDLEAGAILEISWRRNEIVIYQDKKECACLPVLEENGPGKDEEIYGVVDLIRTSERRRPRWSAKSTGQRQGPVLSATLVSCVD
ncbi:unnamed protein product [Durusdinium trenchii]|uniref:NHR domain-containing protein n=1 Tax=Durusdinium trenchii TaxID=1381693 RepID=A0ABP0RHA4_9DINO